MVTPAGGGLPTNDAAKGLETAKVINEESKGRLIAGGTVPLVGFKQGVSKEMTLAIKDLVTSP
ncbi:hypothetical protein ACFLVC_02635 [Chloroflexota bacterium]